MLTCVNYDWKWTCKSLLQNALRLNFTTTSAKILAYYFFALDLAVMWRNVSVKWHVYCIQQTRFGLSAFNRQNPVIIVNKLFKDALVVKAISLLILLCSLMSPFAIKVFFLLFLITLSLNYKSTQYHEMSGLHIRSHNHEKVVSLSTVKLPILHSPWPSTRWGFHFPIKKCSFYLVLVQFL